LNTGSLKRKASASVSNGGTGSGNANGNKNNAKNSKNQKPNSGESKGLAGGNITNINTNMKNIRGGASALSKVATVLTFDDILNEEPKAKSNNAASLRITGPEKQPKRGQTQQKLNKKSSSSSGIFDQSLSSGPKNNSNKNNKNSNVTYRSTILGQAIGKLLDNKSKITNNSTSGKFGNIVKSKSRETVEVIKTSTKKLVKTK